MSEKTRHQIDNIGHKSHDHIFHHFIQCPCSVFESTKHSVKFVDLLKYFN